MIKLPRWYWPGVLGFDAVMALWFLINDNPAGALTMIVIGLATFAAWLFIYLPRQRKPSE